MVRKIVSVCASVIALSVAGDAAAFDEKAVADFYKGKTVRVVVGFAPGGSVDLYSRLAARQLSKYIPGNPTVIVENQAGGGGVAAANVIYASEQQDGTVIGSTGDGFIHTQLMGVSAVRYDVTKINFLASASVATVACFARTDSGVARIQDIIGKGGAKGKELIIAAEGVGHFTHLSPAVMNAALGTNFKIVTGYRGGGPIRLAIEQKEANGACSTVDEINASPDPFVGAKPMTKVLVVMGAATPEHPVLKGVPAAETLAQTDDGRRLLQLAYGPSAVSKSYWVPPNVPKDRVEALRVAFAKALTDPAYFAEAERSKLVPSAKNGADVTKIVRDIMATNEATIRALAGLATAK